MNQTHKKTKLKKVVFLDRDGVINQDSVQYIKSWSEFKFLAGSLKALKKLKDHGFATIVITNQSAVNRKLFTLKVLEDIHTRMQAAIHAAGGRFDAPSVWLTMRGSRPSKPANAPVRGDPWCECYVPRAY